MTQTTTLLNKDTNQTNTNFDEVYDSWLKDISYNVNEPDAIYLAKSDFDNPAKRFSYADFLKIPESNHIMEILNGILSLFASPVTVHARITSILTHNLWDFIKKKKGKCYVYHNPFCVRLSPDGATDDDKIYNVVQPDICVIWVLFTKKAKKRLYMFWKDWKLI
jgi:hypothetical protein